MKFSLQIILLLLIFSKYCYGNKTVEDYKNICDSSYMVIRVQKENIKFINLKNLDTTTEPIILKSNFKDISRFKDSIYHIGLYNIPKDTLLSICSYLNNVISFYWFNNHIQELPNELVELNKIEEFRIDAQNLIYFPVFVTNYGNLKLLSIRNSKISRIPSEINLCINLIRLNLNNNKISILPKEIGCLGKMSYLDLSDNDLVRIPRSIGRLSNLVELWLENNQIKKIPDNLCYLTNMQRLYVRNNKLKKLPSNISNLDTLVVFEWHDNDFNKNDLDFLNEMYPFGHKAVRR